MFAVILYANSNLKVGVTPIKNVAGVFLCWADLTQEVLEIEKEILEGQCSLSQRFFFTIFCTRVENAQHWF